MKKLKKKINLAQKHIILSNGTSWVQFDYPINRFKFKNKDWKNHYIWHINKNFK